MFPEAVPIEKDTATVQKEAKETTALPNEGTENYDLSSFKSTKSWKKSISSFFRNQIRSSKSNDGDNPSGSKSYDENEVAMEQKWQSLGKIFRRKSFIDQNPRTERETSSQKRFAVRSILSSYFGKYKTTDNANEKNIK